MQQAPAQRQEIKLVDIHVRTNNQNEADWTPGKLFPCVQQYFHQQLFNQIPNRKKSGTTYCAYTGYKHNHTEDYINFIGEETSSFDNIPDELTIPPQHYIKFTTMPGAMPNVLHQAWGDIWEVMPQTSGGNRRYHTDFEFYDKQATEQQNIVSNRLV